MLRKSKPIYIHALLIQSRICLVSHLFLFTSFETEHQGGAAGRKSDKLQCTGQPAFSIDPFTFICWPVTYAYVFSSMPHAMIPMIQLFKILKALRSYVCLRRIQTDQASNLKSEKEQVKQ